MINTDHTPKTPRTATGFFALLGSLLRVKGSGVSKISQEGGVAEPARGRFLAMAVLAAGVSLLVAPVAFAGVGYRSAFSFASPEGFNGPVGLAVDNSAGPSKGDVYVVDQGNEALKKFSVSGATATQLWNVALPGGATPNQATVDDYAGVDQGDVYVAGYGSGTIYQVNPAGTAVVEVLSGLKEPTGVAVDAAGDFFVSSTVEEGGVSESAVSEYNADWVPIEAGGLLDAKNAVVKGLNGPQTLAVDPTGEHIYVATAAGTIQATLVAGSYMSTTLDEASSTGVTVAPSGDVFVDQGNEVAVYEPSGTLLGLLGSGVLSEGYGVGVSTSDAYVADHATGQVDVFAEGPAVNHENSPSVTADEAEVSAQIATDEETTSYQVQYGTASVEEFATAEVSVAGASAPVAIEQRLASLQAATTYHFRFVVSNPHGHATGEERTFTTPAAIIPVGETCPNAKLRAEQPYGLGLPDCRAYEMVSPVEKNGNDATDPERNYSRASLSGEALVFTSGGSFAHPDGSQGNNQFLARRGPAGWSTQSITPSFAAYGTTGYAYPYESLIFTPDLEKGVATTDVSLPGTEAPAGLYELYLADFATGSYQWLSTTPTSQTPYRPLEDNVAEGASTDLSHVVFAEHVHGAMYEWFGNDVTRVGISNSGDAMAATVGRERDVRNAVSSDGSRVYFTSDEQLYERVNIDQPHAGKEQSELNANEECTEPAKACTIEVSASQKTNGAGPRGTDLNGVQEARYWGASANGAKVFFTSPSELTNDSNTGVSDRQEVIVGSGTYTLTFKGQTTGSLAAEASPGEVESALQALSPIGAGNVTVSATGHGNEVTAAYIVTFVGALAGSEQPPLTASSPGGTVVIKALPRPGDDLYEYDLESGKLSDLTVDDEAEGANVQGVVQISDEGQYVYFVAKSVLTGEEENQHHEKAKGDAANLYVSHEGDPPKFIATLAAGDAADWQSSGYEVDDAAVSADGSRLAFVSEASLTGYDNEPAGDSVAECGSRCAEVYMYDVESSGSGSLTCVSCNPTGAQPIGPSSLGEGDGERDAGYERRNFSEDGSRLFFQSFDALVPQDRNGRQDVYEYEDGHLYPISDVAGKDESFFLDAGANGNDVFIGTADQLVAEDDSDNVEVYDARVGGGFSEPAAPPSCDNADSCKPPESPQPAIFGTPSSATLSGPVDSAPTPTVVTPKKKTSAQLKAEKLAKALKSCRRDKKKAKRQTCERHARAKYDATKARKKEKAKKSDRTSNDRRTNS